MTAPTSAMKAPSKLGKPWRTLVPQAFIVLLVITGLLSLHWVRTLPDRLDEQQTIVVGPTHFAPDSDAAIRVVVQDLTAGRPIAGAHVEVSLEPPQGRAISLFEGQTDETGSLPVHFHLPADAPTNALLVVETRSEAGRDRVEKPVTIQRDYRLLLSTDKPLYQPGQTIHMRVLALSTYDLAPALATTVDFMVQDAKGNKVYRKSVPTSDFGIAATDFTLANMVNQGNYKLSVSIGDADSNTIAQAEKTVEVRPYVLPKFALNLSTDRSFYLPGENVQGLLQVDYFFGKPVASGQVQIIGSVWDVERTVVVDVHGQTDQNGTYAFSFDLPEYFAGSGLDTGQTQFALEVTVIDQTEHAEQTSLVLPIATQPLLIEAIAESGVLKPGVENVVYLLTAYPDGRPAPTQLRLSVDNGEWTELSSSEFGLTEFTLIPQADVAHTLDIVARDETGLSANRQIVLESAYGGDNVLLRTDRAAYVVGESMHLLALSPLDSGSIYLDIVKAGQTLSTRATPITDGRAEFVVDLGPDLYGTLELHAYKVLLDGTIVRDTRLVVVDAPNDLAITISPDRDTYLPGDIAKILFQTGDASNPEVGVQTALGLAIVDESVFALQQQDPGFAKLYFLLEQQLLEPFYQIQGFELPTTIPSDQTPLREAQDTAAKATWAGVSTAAVSPVNSRPVKMAALYLAQEEGFTRLGQLSSIGLILIPLLLWAVGLVSLRQSGLLKRSLKRLALAYGIILLVGIPWGYMLASTDLGEGTLLLLAVAFGLGILALTGYAWIKRDTAAQMLTLLTLAWGALLFLLIQASEQGSPPSDGLLLGMILATLLIPGAYILFGQGRWLQLRRFAGGIATAAGALSALPSLLLILVMLTSVMSLGSRGRTFGLDGAPLPQNGILFEAMATPPPGEMPLDKGTGDEGRGGDEHQAGSAEPPRLRQYFPETLYWAPEILTDENGLVSLDIPMADSITTWRLTALASSQDGRLGFSTHGIRVFQDFFVDIDLPVALTQGDEISIPVGVFNYLPEAQQVRLVVEQESWFELLGEAEQTLTIDSNDIEVVYFAIRVLEFSPQGRRQGFQVTAWGEQMSDAIRREVRVLPDGKEIRLSESDWLRESKTVAVEIPPEAVPGTAYVEVKIYPGVMAQVIEGLEKILRMPHG